MTKAGVLTPVNSRVGSRPEAPVQPSSAQSSSSQSSPSQSPADALRLKRSPFSSAPVAFPQTDLTWSVAHPKPGCYAIRSQADLASLWHAQSGIGPCPEVDFERFMVLAVFAGEGCCRESLTISRIKQDAAFTTVYVCAFTQRWTTRNPMHVVQVPRTLQPVQFVRLG